MSISTWGADLLEGLRLISVWAFTTESSLQLPGNALPIKGPPAFVLLCIVLVIWSIRWAVRDAKARGKSGFVAGLFILVAAWPFSLLFWRWLRPPVLATPPWPMPPLPASSSLLVPPPVPAPVSPPRFMS